MGAQDVVNFMKRHEVVCLIIAVIIGLTVGLLLSGNGLGDSDAVTIFSLPGSLWLKSLKMIVLPMIAFSMIQSMVMLRNMEGAGKIGALVVGLYLVTTLVAAIEGCIVSALILNPTVDAMELSSDADETDLTSLTIVETLVGMIGNLIPSNLVMDPATNNLLPVILAAIVFGTVVKAKNEDGTETVTIKLITELNHVVNVVIGKIMSVTPVGVGSLVFRSAARLDFAEVGGVVGLHMLTVVVGLFMHVAFFYPSLLVLAGRNPLVYFRNILPALVTAIGTSSSAASLPVSIECAVKNNKISHTVADFVLSLGATINMDGTTIYLICATCFLGNLHGMNFGFSEFFTTVFLATLCSMGSAPVPSASLVLLTTILTAVGVPVDETFGLITAVDWILDRIRTAVNVCGDATVAAMVDARVAGRLPIVPDSNDSDVLLEQSKINKSDIADNGNGMPKSVEVESNKIDEEDVLRDKI